MNALFLLNWFQIRVDSLIAENLIFSDTPHKVYKGNYVAANFSFV